MDLSKAFDKVWHQGLLFKLESFGICGKLLNLPKDYFSNRFQRLLLNDQKYSWLRIKAGVPQGPILGPLLFLIHINDLPDRLSFISKLFADDNPSNFYNDIEIFHTDSQKHLGLVLDNNLAFKKNIKDKLNKAYFGVGKIKRLRDMLPQSSFINIYKSFIRSHIDYGDVIYDQPNNDSFTDKIE